MRGDLLPIGITGPGTVLSSLLTPATLPAGAELAGSAPAGQDPGAMGALCAGSCCCAAWASGGPPSGSAACAAGTSGCAAGLARPYARAVAGTPLNTSFAHTDPARQFTLCYTLNTAIAAPTEIYVHFENDYPAGVVVAASPSLNVTVDARARTVTAWTLQQAKTGDAACLFLRAKP